MTPTHRRVAGAVIALMVLSAACSQGKPTTRPPSEELREQIHAATGHEPENCTDLRGGDAQVTINSEGAEGCLMVSADWPLTLINEDTVARRFFVSDPGGNDVPRHIRVDAEVGPGEELDIDPVSSLLGPGIYPYWIQGLQKSGATGTLIVR